MEGFTSFAKGLRRHSQIIEGNIENESDAKQLVIPHVMILIPVKRAKPAWITNGKIAIMPLKQRHPLFVAAFSGDQTSRSGSAVGDPIHSRAVKWIDKTGRIPDQHEPISGERCAVIRKVLAPMQVT